MDNRTPSELLDLIVAKGPLPDSEPFMVVTLHTPETIYTARHTPSWFLLAAAGR